MKRAAFIVVTAAFFCGAFAENWASSEGSCFGKGNMNVTAGISALHFGGYGLFDYAIHDAISVGAEIGYNGYSYSSLWRYNYMPIVARGSFHPFNLAVLAEKVKIKNKLDPYAGISMGWNIGWATWRNSGVKLGTAETGGFIFRENIGVRFYPTPRFYINFEEGGGLGLFNFGVGYKL